MDYSFENADTLSYQEHDPAPGGEQAREASAKGAPIKSASNAPTYVANGLLQPPTQLTSPKERLRLSLYTRLLMVDIFVIFLAFQVTGLVHLGTGHEWISVRSSLLMIGAYLLCAFQGRAYSLEVLSSTASSLQRSAKAFASSVAIVIAVLFSVKASADFSRLVLVAGSALAFAGLALSRWYLGQRWGNRHNWNFINEIRLVDGKSVFPARGELVFFADQLQLDPNCKDPLYLDRLGRLLRNADRIILDCPPERRQAWTHLLKGIGADVEIAAPELAQIGALALRNFGGRSTIVVGTGPLGLRDRVLKRSFDLLISLVAILLIAPVMLLVAVAIKLDSRGPIFFRQDRLGQGNRIFQVLKFRTMRTEECDAAGKRSTSRQDDRVTRVGRFLRSSSIDELPQLFNVLAGDMSIAGPRPHALGSTAEEAFFWNIDHSYYHRHAVKPGITGLAQVRGFRGATETRGDVTNRVQSDLEYLSGWSLWRDIIIMAQTVRVLFHSRAY